IPEPVRALAVSQPEPAATAEVIPAPVAALATLLDTTAVPPREPVVDEELEIKQALQRYRRAYEGLDARSAQAVWPAVNQAALARAFDGLQSQTLTFDTCDVELHEDEANATCHGSAKYIAKIGSREPRL